MAKYERKTFTYNGRWTTLKTWVEETLEENPEYRLAGISHALRNGDDNRFFAIIVLEKEV
jgi:hypothetical protein